MEPKGSWKAIYGALLPARLRYRIYEWRNPEYRLGARLRKLTRDGIEQFMDSVANQGLLRGNVLEVGAGGRVANSGRFAADARNYWRTDVAVCFPSKIDVFCDCTKMPFNNESLDAVICSEVLEHVPDFPAAIRELCRVVKPGGHLVCTMPFFFPLHGTDRKDYADFWRVTPRNLKLLFVERFDLLREHTVHLFSSDDPFVVAVQQLWRRKDEKPTGV